MTVFTIDPNTDPVYKVKIDFLQDNFGSSSDISQYVKDIQITAGHAHELSLTADAGSCTITVKNDSKLFSPFNTGGTFYGHLVPGIAVSIWVQAAGGAFQNAATNGTATGMYQSLTWYPVWQGWTVDYEATGGSTGNLEAKIICEDTLGLLNNCYVTVPLLTTVDADSLIATIVNAAFLEPPGCFGTLFSGQPSNGDTMTLTTKSHSGTIVHENVPWTYVTTLSGAANEIVIGSSLSVTIVNSICALIGSDRYVAASGATVFCGLTAAPSGSAGTYYSNTFIRSNYWITNGFCWNLSQAPSATDVTGGATMTVGNSYLPFNSRLFGNYFTPVMTHTHSGADYITRDTCLSALPAQVNSRVTMYNASLNTANATVIYKGSTTNDYRNIYPFVSDQNQITKSTNALDYIRSICDSEFGRVYVDVNGQMRLIYWTDMENAYNRQSSAGLSGSQTPIYLYSSPTTVASIKRNKKINEAQVTHTPRSTIGSSGSAIVVGKNPNTILVPGQSGSDRWNGTVLIPGGGSVTVKIPYTDPTTGQPMGATQIVLPLSAGTDWNASDNPNANGTTIPYNYTNYTPPQLTFAVVNNGSYAEVTIHNIALGPLYVFGLQIRGSGITNYQSITQTFQSATMGKQKFTHTHSMTLPVDPLFAYGIAGWLVTKYATSNPNIYDKLNTNNMNYIGDRINVAVIPWSLDLYQQVGYLDNQLGIIGTGPGSSNFHIIGKQINIPQHGIPSFQIQLERLDQFSFFIVGTSTIDGTDILGV